MRERLDNLLASLWAVLPWLFRPDRRALALLVTLAASASVARAATTCNTLAAGQHITASLWNGCRSALLGGYFYDNSGLGSNYVRHYHDGTHGYSLSSLGNYYLSSAVSASVVLRTGAYTAAWTDEVSGSTVLWVPDMSITGPQAISGLDNIRQNKGIRSLINTYGLEFIENITGESELDNAVIGQLISASGASLLGSGPSYGLVLSRIVNTYDPGQDAGDVGLFIAPSWNQFGLRVGDVTSHYSGSVEVERNVSISGSLTVYGALSGSFAANSMSDGTAASPGLPFANDSDTGFYRIGPNDLGVSAGGTRRASVNTSGVGVTGDLSASGGVYASGVANISGATTIYGATTVNNTMTATSLTATGSGAALMVTGNGGLSGSLEVDGVVKLDGHVSHTSTTTMTGAVTAGSTLAVTGNTGVSGSLEVDGTLKADGHLNATSTANVSGAATFGSTVAATGNVGITGSLEVDGIANFDGGLNSGGTIFAGSGIAYSASGTSSKMKYYGWSNCGSVKMYYSGGGYVTITGGAESCRATVIAGQTFIEGMFDFTAASCSGTCTGNFSYLDLGVSSDMNVWNYSTYYPRCWLAFDNGPAMTDLNLEGAPYYNTDTIYVYGIAEGGGGLPSAIASGGDVSYRVHISCHWFNNQY